MSEFLNLYVAEMLGRVHGLLAQHPPLPALPGADAIYARISDDKAGEALGVDRQVQDGHTIAGRIGAPPVAAECIFADNDISASTKSTKPRPDFERMLAYILRGDIRRVFGYSTSRLTRRPMEYEVLIQVAQQTGVTFHTAASGDDDLNTASGRMTARIKAAVDAAEAETISERATRKKAQMAQSGKPSPGRHRTYGYTRSYEVVAAEAEVLREMFERRAAGETTTALCKDLNARGIPSSTGREWRQGALAGMLKNRFYLADRVYRGEVVARGTWEPIIDRATFEAAQVVIAAGRQNHRRPGTFMLSGTLRCGFCLTPMYSNGDAYRCSRNQGGCGGTHAAFNLVEPLVLSAAYQHRAGHSATVRAAVTDDRNYDAELDALDGRIREARAAATAGHLSMLDAGIMIDELREQARELSKLRAAAAASRPRSTWFGSLVELEALSTSQKRAFIRGEVDAVFTSRAAGRGRSSFAKMADRLEVHFHNGDVVKLRGSLVRTSTTRAGATVPVLYQQELGTIESLFAELLD